MDLALCHHCQIITGGVSSNQTAADALNTAVGRRESPLNIPGQRECQQKVPGKRGAGWRGAADRGLDPVVEGG